MKKTLFPFLLLAIPAFAGTNVLEDADAGLVFSPINHATMVVRVGGKVVYVDPVGGADAFKGFGKPDLILVTDIHGDHMSKTTLEAVKTAETRIIAPQAVIDQLGFGEPLANGGKTADGDLGIEAVPMYNTTEGRLERHTKGRGNGYVLTHRGKRVYISGDTEDIPEMRALKGIDYAFVCMNLPYTMSVDQAASAVLAFKPKTAIPYHHRGSDVNEFKRLVNAGDPGIRVVMLEWYPK